VLPCSSTVVSTNNNAAAVASYLHNAANKLQMTTEAQDRKKRNYSM